MRNHRVMTGLLAALLLLIVGCGGSDDDAAPEPDTTSEADQVDDGFAGQIDVCAIVDVAAAEKALGANPLVPSSDSSAGTCQFQVEGEPMPYLLVVHMNDGLAGTTIEEVAALTAGWGRPEDGELTAIPALDGGVAFDMFGAPALLFAHGDDLFMLSSSGPATVEALTELGETLVAEL